MTLILPYARSQVVFARVQVVMARVDVGIGRLFLDFVEILLHICPLFRSFQRCFSLFFGNLGKSNRLLLHNDLMFLFIGCGSLTSFRAVLLE